MPCQCPKQCPGNPTALCWLFQSLLVLLRGAARVRGVLFDCFKGEVRITLRDAYAAKHRAQLVSIPLVTLCYQPHRAADEQAVEAFFDEVLCDREIRVVWRIAQYLREARNAEIVEAVAQLGAYARNAVDLRVVVGTSDGDRVI